MNCSLFLFNVISSFCIYLFIYLYLILKDKQKRARETCRQLPAEFEPG